jgi:hypothetical protein
MKESNFMNTRKKKLLAIISLILSTIGIFLILNINSPDTSITIVQLSDGIFKGYRLNVQLFDTTKTESNLYWTSISNHLVNGLYCSDLDNCYFQQWEYDLREDLFNKIVELKLYGIGQFQLNQDKNLQNNLSKLLYLEEANLLYIATDVSLLRIDLSKPNNLTKILEWQAFSDQIGGLAGFGGVLCNGFKFNSNLNVFTFCTTNPISIGNDILGNIYLFSAKGDLVYFFEKNNTANLLGYSEPFFIQDYLLIQDYSNDKMVLFNISSKTKKIYPSSLGLVTESQNENGRILLTFDKTNFQDLLNPIITKIYLDEILEIAQ